MTCTRSNMNTGKSGLPCLKLGIAACLAACLAVGSVQPQPVHAALAVRQACTLQDTWNPVPLADDVVLPMPGGLSMAFRVVAVPAQGFLWDMALRPGSTMGTDDRAFYDRPYEATLSAPFSLNDLPASCKAPVQGLTGTHLYYLVAKYEVTKAQWRSVMEESFDANALKPDDATPATDVSWYEAVSFTERYTTWLLKNHPESLPHYNGDERNVGFVRLPTELEWEYAARGGHAVSAGQMRQNEFFPMPDQARVADYAVYLDPSSSHASDKASRIGSRKPNPAGLHDTAGNAAEMTIDAFRFSVGRRLLGSAGGFVRKGGSYRNATEEIIPGRREESPFFLKDGPYHSSDLGLRPVISGINTPGGNRMSIVGQEYRNGVGPSTQAAETPRAELERIIAETHDPAVKKNLETLLATLKDAEFAQGRERLATAGSILLSCAATMQSMRDFNRRAEALLESRKGLEIQMKNSMLPDEQRALLKEKSKKITELVDSFRKACAHTAMLYIDKLTDAAAIPTKLQRSAVDTLKDDFSKDDGLFSKAMLRNMDVVTKHLAVLSKHGKLTREGVLKDALEKKIK